MPIKIKLLALSLLASACTRQAAPTTPNKVVEMDALRIVAKHDEQGSYSFESYDAEELFQRANGELDAGRCSQAVELYDRLGREFAGGRFHSAALYNAGLCLAQLHENEAALARFEALLTQLPNSPDVKHARFQAGHLQIALERWEAAERTATELLAHSDLDASERLEAMATQAQALLGRGELEPAERVAKQALTFYRTRTSELIADPFYAGAANFVLAEATRLRAEQQTFPDTTPEEQKAVLVRRAQLLLDAQREYFNTIRHTEAHWASAAGHRIGAMYDRLWKDLMAAPVPETLSEGARELYPQELAKLIKPLLRHAIRYWELTLLMVERTGVRSEWAELTRRDLERTRSLLLEQPPGPGGLPAASPPAPASPGEAVDPSTAVSGSPGEPAASRASAPASPASAPRSPAARPTPSTGGGLFPATASGSPASNPESPTTAPEPSTTAPEPSTKPSPPQRPATP